MNYLAHFICIMGEEVIIVPPSAFWF